MPSRSINQPINRSTNTWYADVILPLSLPGLLTYAVPEGLEDHAKPGVRVRVQVGKKKTYTALIHHIHREKPSGYEVRPLLAILDHEPFVNSLQLKTVGLDGGLLHVQSRGYIPGCNPCRF